MAAIVGNRSNKTKLTYSYSSYFNSHLKQLYITKKERSISVINVSVYSYMLYMYSRYSKEELAWDIARCMMSVYYAIIR